MRLISISFHDFKSYADADLDLSAINLASIVGPNGAGKSSILEGAQFALFGARSLRNLDSFIRQGCEECRVSVVFDTERDRYRVTRTRSNRGSGKSPVELCRQEDGAWVAEGTGAREIDERIAQILGVDEETLLLTSVVSQGDSGSFFALQPAKRLEAFAAILKLDEQYGPLEDAWKAKRDEAKEALADSRKEIERLEADAQQLDLRQGELASRKTSLEICRSSLKEAEDNLEAIRKAAEQARENTRLLETAQKLIDERERLIVQIAGKASLEAQLSDRDEVLRSIGALEIEEREAAKASEARAVATAELSAARKARDETAAAGTPKAQEVSRLTEQIRSLETRLEGIRATDAPVCDRCGQAIGGSALEQTTAQLSGELEAAINRRTAVSQEAEALRTLYADQQEQVKSLEERLAELPEPHNVSADLQDAKNKLSLLDAIPARLATIQAAEDRKFQIDIDLETACPWGIDVLREQASGAALADEDKARGLVESKRAEATDLERAIARHEEAIAMLKNSTQRLQELKGATSSQEQDYADAELLRKAFSKWGIPSLVISNVLGALEVKVNELLGLYDGGLAVHFESEKETGNGARDSLEIMVYDGQDWRPFETFSGGEKYRVASAMRLGLALLLAHRAGARVETLIVDEPEGLDFDGRQHLARILEHISDHFKLVLLLTHYDDLKDAMPSQVLVSRGDDGLSRVEVVA